MFTRRGFLRTSGMVGAGFLAPWNGIRRVFSRQRSWNCLDSGSIPKYELPLVIPPAMPQTPPLTPAVEVDYYEIAVRQFRQQILPPPYPMTTVWSYGSVNHPETFNYPAFTIEARHGQAVRVKWINGLVDADGRYLPHLLPVDPTLHWANPPGGPAGRDMRPDFSSTPPPYTGPVPIVTHLHGGHTHEESDGYAEAWYLPKAKNIPGGFAWFGSWYRRFGAKAQARTGQAWTPGTAVFQYENDQDASTLWYHDHTLGMTRLNVYAGPAGFYLLRGGDRDLPDGVLPGPAPALGDPPGTRYYEIPIAIQDRSFKKDGSGALFYPDSREFFDGFEGPYIPHSDVSPIWNPEFFGNTTVVNGRTWPYLEVEPRRYRFRLLNGCNSRFLILEFSDPNLKFWQIGADGGFLPAPVQLGRLLLSPAERADVIVDLTGYPEGTEILLKNIGPDEPFGGGIPGIDFPVADPNTTGQVMQLRVVPLTGPDLSTPPDQLVLPDLSPLGPATNTRQVSLNEEESEFPGFEGPIAALLGTYNGTPVTLGWDDPITEHPALGAIEVWEMYNFTEDAHPIHIHEVQFEVVDRQPFGGSPYGPEPGETGFKDTVIAYPGEITRVKALYDRPGLYVWHCHIVEHEDNEMMRPYFIGPNPPAP
ncbi:MAG: bilirubin oxidase [Planctomycetota bacterium]|nr:MAG: bilirubin oxidase [Planctomycetota bacterium]